MANRSPALQRSSWKIAALGTAFGVAIAGGVLFTDAVAVHNSPFPFELDGNVADAGGNALDDWQHVFGFGGTGGALAPTTSVFIHDLPASGDKETMYDAGKDVLDVTAWTRKDVTKVVPDKDNILDAFAAQYLVDTDGDPNTKAHRVIYFGSDRFANNGDATMSFWFFQKKLELTGTNGFSPAHTVRNVGTGQRGDILVQVDFLNGGTESRLRVFEWVGSGGSDGPLDLLRPPADVNGATVCLADDSACATTNDAGNVTSFWPYVPKAGTSGKFPAESFFEGGIDLTALVGDVCLNSFLASTRSSQQTTSDLKDLAMGDFNTCGHIKLVRKECQAEDAVSPLYLADANVYQTKHVLTIRNDGLGGDVYDVKVKDDSVGGDNICRIVAISGGVGNPVVPAGGIYFPNNSTFIKVADSLAAGIPNQMSVTLICTSPMNAFPNTASIQAGQQPGGSSLNSTYAETEADTTPQCVKTVNNKLVLTKSCPTPVVLDASNGYKPKVCVDITLKNDGEANIDIKSLTDSHNDSTSSNLLSQLPSTIIKPGETVTGIQDCYYPAKPDSNQTDPDKAQYGDTVNASGVPANNLGITVEADGKSTTCSLCPVGING